MSTDPRNIRNIPTEVLQVARAIATRTGSSESDVLRQALCSGILVEATKVSPDRVGTFGGLQGSYLAKALRRHLSSAIDFLLEQGQHPLTSMLAAVPTQAQIGTAAPAESDEPAFNTAMADELEGLGMGMGLSFNMEEEPVGVSS
jgi:hypothetical protein